MGQIRLPESIPTLGSTAGTATLGPAIVNVGGQQYRNLVSLTCNLGTVGAGGLDTGSLAANTLYYLHAVVSNGALALLASLSKTAPTGFSVFRYLSQGFLTNGSSQITAGQMIDNFNSIYLSATSNVKTPTANANYSAMVGNSVTLTPGTWILNGLIQGDIGSAGSYQSMGWAWCTANGADTGSLPATLTTSAGLNNLQFAVINLTSAAAADRCAVIPATVRVTVTANTTVFLVPVSTGTPANQRLTTYIYAQRIGANA